MCGIELYGHKTALNASDIDYVLSWPNRLQVLQ